MALTRIKTDQITDGEVKSADLDTNITLSGDLSVTDITMTGELNGPATFYIDPAPHDPDTDGATNGLVVIRGDLQVDGTTTTVNSTTMDVADLNITLASGAANAAAADGAGLTVDGASATILYDGTDDEWDFNKNIHVDTILTDTGIVHADDTDTYIKFLPNRIYSDVGGNRILDAQAGDVKINGPDGAAGIAIDTGGYVGIGGVTNPTRNLHVETADSIPLRIEGENAGAISYSEFVNASTSAVGNGVGLEFRALTTTQERQLFYVQSSWSNNTDADRESLTRIFTSGGGSQQNPLTIVGDKVGIGTGTNTPNALLHISDTSPHIDVGPHGGNRAKFGYHDLDVYIGSTSSTGEIIFKNNISSTDAPQTSGDTKVKIADVGMTIYSDTYNILDIATDTNDDQTSTDGIVKITNGASHTTKAEFRWDESEDLVHVSYGDHGRHISINSSGNVGIGTGSVSPVHTLDVDGAIATRQVRHSIRPTLNLDFTNSKELDPRITFYRDSIATYYDSKGTPRYANHNEPRFDHDPVTGESKGLLIEEERTNIFDYSNNPEKWSLVSAASFDPIVNNRKSPDETFNATSLIVTGGDPYFYKNNLNLNGTYTFSYWIKAWGNAVGKHYTTRLTNISTNQSIADTLPSEWTRKTFTFTTGATTTAYVGVEAPDNSPANGDEVSIWGAQLEAGAFATSYIPSDTRFTSRASSATYYDETGILRTAPANSPRYGYKYDGRKWVETGLILEDSSTNVWTHAGSESSRGLIAATGSTTRTFFYDTAPDGSQEAVRIQWSNGYAYRVLSNTLGDSDPWAISFYIKPYSGTARFGFGGTFGSQYWTFNFDTLAVANSAAHTNTTVQYGFIRDVGNGWYRVEITFLSTGASGYTEIQWSGTGSADYAIWGVQFEESKYAATSFIYGSSASTTRSADVATSVAYTRGVDKAFTENLEWYEDGEGTLYAEHNVDRDITESAWGVVQLNDGTTNNFIGIRYRSSGSTGEVITANGGTSISATGAVAADLNYYNKSALAFAINDFGATTNGGTVITSTSGDVPVVTQMYIGIGEGINTLNGHIKKIAYYPERLTNAELQALTEND